MIKFLIVMLLLNFSKSIIAQQKIVEGVSFVGEKNNPLISLNRFLSVSVDSISEKCISAEGLFKFQIDVEGNVADIEVLGNLPDKLVKLIKARIALTNNHWMISDSIKKKKESLVFFYPVYISMQLKYGCNAKDPKSYRWLFEFFDKKNIILGTKGYMIKPELYFGII